MLDPAGQRYRVTYANTGNEVKPGDTIRDFRGTPAIFEWVSRGPSNGREAKVVVREANGQTYEYYASVYNLTVEVI